MIRNIWNKIGWILFWFCLPALFVYLRRNNRPRIALTSGDKILVVKSWLGDGRWQLPGGGLHKNEDAKTGVLRELFEETGLKIDPKKVITKGDFTQVNDLLHFTYTLFTASVDANDLPEHSSTEIVARSWVNKKDLRPGNAQQHVLESLK